MSRPRSRMLATVPAVAAGTPAQAIVINPADFQQVEMARGVAEMGEPMSLAVLPDLSVLHTARAGEFGRNWIKPVQVTASGGVGEIITLPWTGHR